MRKARNLTERTRLLVGRAADEEEERVSGWIGDSGIEFSFCWPYEGWYRDELSADAMVIPLYIITFSCALADAVTLKAYSTFATSMTGNTITIAMSIAGTTSKPCWNAVASLAAFVVVGLVFGQLGNIYGHRRRSWLIFILNIQLFILAIAWFVLRSPVFRSDGEESWVYLLLLGAQGGIQVTHAANTGVRELPTAMMTTPYAAFVSDPALFVSGAIDDVTSRNRRFLYILIFWSGALLGALLTRWFYLQGMTFVVFILKLVVLVYFLFSSPKEIQRPVRRMSRDERNVAM